MTETPKSIKYCPTCKRYTHHRVALKKTKEGRCLWRCAMCGHRQEE